MGRLTDTDLANIIDQADIIEIVGDKIPLTPMGKEFVGLCPFHPDHKPSLMVSPKKRIFKCFSCGAGGNVIQFVQKYDRTEFWEAARAVAAFAGYNLTVSEQERRSLEETSALCDILEKATKIYEDALSGNANAKEYLVGRGVKSETIEDFRIGFAPNEWSFIMERLGPRSSHKVPFETLKRAGLISSGSRGDGYYDRFRDRIMFPITDSTGRVIAFAGRDLGNSHAKYLNSPETPTYHKSEVLFGLHQASDFIKRDGRVIVTEGYLDSIVGQQEDFPVVATGGTAFTKEQIALLTRRHPTAEIFLAFDGDEAGKKATSEASKQLLGHTNAYACSLLPGKDPDEIVLARPVQGDTLFNTEPSGRETFSGIISNGVPVFEYYVSGKLEDRKLEGPAATSKFLREVAEDFMNIPQDILPVYVSALSEKIGVDADSIRTALSARNYEMARGGTIPPRDHCEKELLHGMMRLPSVLERFSGIVSVDLFTNPERRAVCEYLMQGGNVDSVHTPLLQPAADATERIMQMSGSETLRAHVLHDLLSPPSSVQKKTLGHFEQMYALLMGWQAFDTVTSAETRGHSIENLGPLTRGLETALAGLENRGRWNKVEEIPGARIVRIADGQCLLVERTWSGDDLPNTFGGLGEYLLAHASDFSRAIGRSPVTNVRENDVLVSLDTEDFPGSKIISVANTTYQNGTLSSSALFARNGEEERYVLKGLLPFVEGADRFVTFHGGHDLAAIRTRAAAYFGKGSSDLKFVDQMKRKHLDASELLARIPGRTTPDKRLRTVETQLFHYVRGFDIRSSQIPRAYEEFVSTGDPNIARGIIEHNIRDTLGPLAILHMASVA